MKLKGKNSILLSDVTVNGKVYSHDEEIAVGIGELIELELTVTSVLKGTKQRLVLIYLISFQVLRQSKVNYLLDASKTSQMAKP